MALPFLTGFVFVTSKRIDSAGALAYKYALARGPRIGAGGRFGRTD